MAVANYHDANGRYPPPTVLGPDGRPWHSWRVLVLPYIEQHKLFTEYSFAEPWDGPNNRKLAGRMPRTYGFHGTETANQTVTNYLAVVGDETVWPRAGTRSDADVTNGRDRTILLVENHGANIHWMEPRDLAFADMDFRVDAPGGVSSRYTSPAVVALDGSVWRLKPTLAPDALRALLTVRGREPLRGNGAGLEPLPDGRQRPARQP